MFERSYQIACHLSKNRGLPGDRRFNTNLGFRYEIDRYYKVTNPKELIHQYATTTPVHTIPGYESLPDGGMNIKVTKQSYSSSTEETFTPFAPYHGGPHSVHPNNFVRQLRDDSKLFQSINQVYCCSKNVDCTQFVCCYALNLRAISCNLDCTKFVVCAERHV